MLDIGYVFVLDRTQVIGLSFRYNLESGYVFVSKVKVNDNFMIYYYIMKENVKLQRRED